MKIAQVINNFSHTSIPVEMAEIMAHDECVDIISFYDSSQRIEQLSQDSCAHVNRLIGCDAKNDLLKGIKELVNVLIIGDYDIIHTHHTLSAAIVSCFRYKLKGKIITTIHGSSFSYSKLQNFIYAYIVHYADGIAYNSNATLNSMYAWQKKMKRRDCIEKVIYNGIDVERIFNADRAYADTFFEKYDIPTSAFLLVQIGRLEKVKNPFSALKAFEMYLRMNDSRKDVYFIFVGDGSQRLELERYACESDVLYKNTKFIGTIKRDEVYSLMHIIDMQIIPSYNEGFCNALFESLSLGNQVLVSDIPVFNELLKNQVEVCKFNPKSVESISEALYYALNNQSSNTGKSKYSDFVSKELSSKKCKEEYFKLYKEVMQYYA